MHYPALQTFLQDPKDDAALRALLVELQQRALRGDLAIHLPKQHGDYQRIDGAPCHTWPEVFVQLAGTGTFTCNGEVVQARAGEVVIIPPGTPHAERLGTLTQRQTLPPHQLVVMCQEHRCLLMPVQAALGGRPEAIAWHEAAEPNADMTARHLVLALSQRWRQCDEHLRQPLLGALLANVLIHMEALLQADAPVGGCDDTGEHFIRRCRWLISGALSDHRLSVADIAQRMGVSADYCSHRYASLSGETLSSAINRYRCRHAAGLLRGSGLRIAAIAWTCGYRDAAYFGRVFSRLYGCSPRDYRQASVQPTAQPS